MNIVQRGVGEKLGDGSYEIHSRFMEIALQDRSDVGFAAGDTLLANMHWNQLRPIRKLSVWMFPEILIRLLLWIVPKWLLFMKVRLSLQAG